MTGMADTGDRTWGHMADTEHFGRTNTDYLEVTKSDLKLPKYAGYTNAAHCMIYSRTNEKAFGIYNTRAVVLMQLRFDGYLGFPGGLVDDCEDIVAGVNRELVEETNVDVQKHPVREEDHVVTHCCPSKKLILHFYALQVPLDDLKLIEENALKAEDYGVETLGTIRVPLYTMGDGYRGFPAFLSNAFAGNSREQLLHSLVHLKLMTEEEVASAREAKPV